MKFLLLVILGLSSFCARAAEADAVSAIIHRLDELESRLFEYELEGVGASRSLAKGRTKTKRKSRGKNKCLSSDFLVARAEGIKNLYASGGEGTFIPCEYQRAAVDVASHENDATQYQEPSSRFLYNGGTSLQSTLSVIPSSEIVVAFKLDLRVRSGPEFFDLPYVGIWSFVDNSITFVPAEPSPIGSPPPGESYIAISCYPFQGEGYPEGSLYCESTFVEIKPKEVKPDDAYSTVRAFFLVPTNGEVDFDCPCTDEQEDFNYGIGRPPV